MDNVKGLIMLLSAPLQDVFAFMDEVCHPDDGTPAPLVRLSKIQRKFLAFCMTGMIVIGGFCWEKMERASFKTFGARAMGWMLRYSIIPWLHIWEASIVRMIKIAGWVGFLVIDDTDRLRSKTTYKLFGVFKTKDKKTAGFSMAQNIVFIVFVTKHLTVPVGFRFFSPDPAWKTWRDNDLQLRIQKVKKSLRPKKPRRDPQYPTRFTLSVQLLEDFKRIVPEAQVTAITADAAYLSSELIEGAEKYFPDAQFISQVCKSNLVSDGKRRKRSIPKSVGEYFKNKGHVETEISFRGKNPKPVKMLSARLYLYSKQRKFHIIALKYDKEIEYRYLAATKLSWRAIDIVRAYSLRWLIEVAIEDWKVYNGWGKMAFQRGAEGACRGVILSLLVDHFLSSNSLQRKQLNANKPIWTAGSLCRYFQCKVILSGIDAILRTPDPMERLKELFDNITNVVEFRPSDKHMSGHYLGDFEESPNLKRKYKYTS